MDAGLPTPQLDRVLTRLAGRLRGLALRRGLGSVLMSAGAWLAFAFLADRWLDLPVAVRVVHGAALVALPAWVAWRELVGRLRRVPARRGLAVLLDRTLPSNQDRFVSALQLRGMPSAEPGYELVRGLVAEAEEAASTADVRAVLDPTQPNRFLLGGVLTSLAAVALLSQDPELTGIFLQRALGRDVAWPRRTTVTLALAESSEALLVSEGRYRIARGSDVSLALEIEGHVPAEVSLHFADGAISRYPTGGARLVRPELRNIQADLVLWATGGDDQRGEPRLELEVLSPPDVTQLVCEITPPEWLDGEVERQSGTDITALEGSTLRLGLVPDPADATGVLRVLGEDQVLPLVAATITLPDGSQAQALTCELVAEKERYVQAELVAPSGMTNPSPGVWALRVRPDRSPEVVMLTPDAAEHLMVPGGALSVRARVSDDHGITSARWEVRDSADLEAVAAEGSFELLSLAPDAFDTLRSARSLVRTRLELSDLAGPTVEPGWAGVLQVLARDAHPSPEHESLGTPVRLRCVSTDEYLRRLKDGLARAGESAGTMLTEAGKLLEQAGAAVADLEVAEGSGDSGLGAWLHGARRLEGDARTLGRDLAGLADGLLHSRIDERSGPALEALGRALEGQAARTFDPEPWRGLAADLAAGRLGSPDLAGELLTLVGMSLELSEDALARVSTHVAEARSAASPEAALEQALLAEAALRDATAQLDALATRLGEWDNFQSVLTLTRDILNRQKNLTERTRKFAEENR